MNQNHEKRTFLSTFHQKPMRGVGNDQHAQCDTTLRYCQQVITFLKKVGYIGKNIFVTFPPPSKIMVFFPAPIIFRWILHHYNLLTSNEHRKNSSYNYIIFTCLIYFYIIFHFFNENKDVIYIKTILLTKYKMRIQRQSNIIILISPKLTQNLHFIIIYALGLLV